MPPKDDQVPTPNSERTFPGIKSIVREHTSDYHVLDATPMYKLGARFKLEMIDGDCCYFRHLQGVDRFIQIHGFYEVDAETMEELRREKYSA